MNISIIGASGGVGREIVVQLLRDRVLEGRETLQLIGGDPHSAHPHLLQGFRADLLDAYSEIAPQIEVINDLEAINGDIVVMTAGRTFATSPETVNHASRDELALGNLPIFERFAEALAAQKRSVPPVVIIVTNPVELGVSVFCRHLPREYVIGMGAHSDSLRFRAEIAQDLGIRRQRVQGYVVGEHGAGLVPLWSSVRVSGSGLSAGEWQAALRDKIKPLPAAEFPAAVARELKSLVSLLHDDPHDGPARAYEHIATLPHNPNCIALEASTEDKMFGTLSVGLDSADGLLADSLYQAEIDILRRMGRRVCEISKLAFNPQYSSKEAIASLFHLAYIYAHNIYQRTDLLIEVNPRHVSFYQRRLGFQQIGELRTCPRVDAPAILLHVALDYGAKQIAKYAGSRDPNGKSLYPYFFSAAEVQGLTSRIVNAA